ncbi:MAG: phosphodiester glycosidase family protein [Cytophagaceae bacterium]|nr:phosphodiester glycosidase family protein [Cytophagaceae bacterium]
MNIRFLRYFFILLFASVFIFTIYLNFHPCVDLTKFEIYKVDLRKQKIEFFLKDSSGKNYNSFKNLKTSLEKQNRNLKFAMNGGMYQTDYSPLGLYIENGKTIRPLNQLSGEGNFYMKPNGVFFITKENKAGISQTEKFSSRNILYATQSGPMLVIDGRIHHAFNKASQNVHIRNGVGILSEHELYFVISKEKVTFYEMATVFKDYLKCNNALYLDGFVSKMYLPQKNWNDLGGEFGVIIAETEKK